MNDRKDDFRNFEEEPAIYLGTTPIKSIDVAFTAKNCHLHAEKPVRTHSQRNSPLSVQDDANLNCGPTFRGQGLLGICGQI